MAKFFGVICTLLAGLCLVGAVDVAAARNLTSDDFVDELAATALEDPTARGEVSDELVAWLDDQPARQAALQAAFGDDWEESMRNVANIAVQTPEFEAEYLVVFEQLRDAEAGENPPLSFDLRPTIAAIRPQLDPSVAESLDRLPPDFFVANETIDEGGIDELDEFDNFNQIGRRLLIWMSLVGVATGVLAVALFRSPLPLAWVGAMAVGLSLLQYVVLQAVKTEVLADQEGALERIAAEGVLDSLTRSTLVPLIITGVTLIVIALATHKAMGSIRSNGDSDDMPIGSDTDWASSPSSGGFPQIVS
jgi:hypothetical protein